MEERGLSAQVGTMVKEHLGCLINRVVDAEETKQYSDGEYVNGFIMYRPTRKTKESEGQESKNKRASVRLIERGNMTGVLVVAKDARDLARF